MKKDLAGSIQSLQLSNSNNSPKNNFSNKLDIVSSNSSSHLTFKKLSKGIDFTFNTIKDVNKVSWKDDAPWFREITDGFCWLAYCHNRSLSKKDALIAKSRAEKS